LLAIKIKIVEFGAVNDDIAYTIKILREKTFAFKGLNPENLRSVHLK